jgi:hypothetical protein
VELTAVTGGAEGSEKPVGFWLLGDGQAADAAGELPPELNGFRFRYEVFPEVLDVVVMEGPVGTFRLVEFRWGQPGPARDLPVSAELALSGGGSLRLVEAVSRTMHAWRPRQAPAAGEPKEPACRLAVSRGGQQREMWLFEGRKPDPEAFGFTFFMRTGGRYVLRRAAVLELADKRGSLGKQTVEFNRPLKVRGYQIVLAGAEGEGSAGGPLTTLPRLVIVRDYAVWALYAGLLLLAVGAPWLLWTRLRNVADTDGWEG